MNTFGKINRLTMNKTASDDVALNYSADITFDVSFGSLKLTQTGGFNVDEGVSYGQIENQILSTALDELKKQPTLFKSVFVQMQWEAAGKPPYAAWRQANFPIEI